MGSPTEATRYPSVNPSARARGGSVCLANARLVLADEVVTGYVVAQDGVITTIGHGELVRQGAIDCGGDFVLPGLVELHTDRLEEHIEPRPRVNWPLLPAISRLRW